MSSCTKTFNPDDNSIHIPEDLAKPITKVGTSLYHSLAVSLSPTSASHDQAHALSPDVASLEFIFNATFEQYCAGLFCFLNDSMFMVCAVMKSKQKQAHVRCKQRRESTEVILETLTQVRTVSIQLDVGYHFTHDIRC